MDLQQLVDARRGLDLFRLLGLLDDVVNVFLVKEAFLLNIVEHLYFFSFHVDLR